MKVIISILHYISKNEKAEYRKIKPLHLFTVNSYIVHN